LPSVVLLENVSGFVRSGGALDIIVGALQAINDREGTDYRLSVAVLDAVDFGVPQRRQRALIVANRSGGRFNWPLPTHAERPVRAWDAIGHLELGQTPPLVGKWADLLPSIPEGWNYQWHTDRGGGRPLFGYRTRYWSFLLKLAKAEPAWTISAQPGPATGPFHWDNRPLTVREMLRLQTFPAAWKVPAGHREQVRQVGNATPPLLAEVIGRELGQQLFGRTYSGRPAHSIAHTSEVPPPREPTKVPPHYIRLEGSHAAHPGPGLGPKPVTRSVRAPRVVA
jgi:DNA (cytosine-5)-methyltransferase 1